MIESLTGVQVIDAALYAKYRERMTPLLHACGGSFGVDVWVSEVLLSPSAQPFNRLFTIRFPSLAVREAFFASPEYLSVKKELFDPSVAARSELSRSEILG